MRVIFTPEARQELRDIGVYIRGQGAPLAAKRLVADVYHACRSLDRLPERYVLAPEYGRSIRRLVIGNYLALYRVVGDRVDIISIRDGRRQPGPLDR